MFNVGKIYEPLKSRSNFTSNNRQPQNIKFNCNGNLQIFSIQLTDCKIIMKVFCEKCNMIYHISLAKPTNINDTSSAHFEATKVLETLNCKRAHDILNNKSFSDCLKNALQNY